MKGREFEVPPYSHHPSGDNYPGRGGAKRRLEFIVAPKHFTSVAGSITPGIALIQQKVRQVAELIKQLCNLVEYALAG